VSLGRVIALCCVFFVALSGDALCREAADFIADWQISGMIVLDAQSAPKSEEIVFKLVRPGKTPFGKHRGFPRLMLDKNQFSITSSQAFPTEELRKGTYIVAAYWNGHFGKSDSFDAIAAPLRIDGLRIQFGPKMNNVLRFRLIDPDLGAGVPNIKLQILLPQTFADPAFANMAIATPVTKDGGLIELFNVPEGVMQIQLTDAPLSRIAIPDNIFLDAEARYPSVTADVDKDRKDIPIVYYSGKKGVFWDALFSKENKPLKTGTILEFAAKPDKINEENPRWDPKLTFRVTVGDRGLVKTPSVPEGVYTVKQIEGDIPEDGEVGIFGMGSVYHVNRSHRLTKPSEIKH